VERSTLGNAAAVVAYARLFDDDDGVVWLCADPFARGPRLADLFLETGKDNYIQRDHHLTHLRATAPIPKVYSLSDSETNP
jgi:hypothetical protein